ncbi:unnamed protein product [Ambrosiozyma monospora]|uniref:Unnamed protein product n=1 Tax=Ambrosiozyma monospora TaxID=43982 RepID=A0ACB5U6Y8_AMBMO|nr:unnamed protein product [Ambrosiozyma monospora]
MLSFRTTEYNGCACKYSPFYDNKLAIATSANYGLVGNGKLYILTIQDNGQITQDSAFETQDGLFDVAWSELHENQMLASSGDGTISLFDFTLPDFPIMKFKEHQREVFSVNWNLVEKSMFCSASWDGSVKVWSPVRGQSLMTLVSPRKDQRHSSHIDLGGSFTGAAGPDGAKGLVPTPKGGGNNMSLPLSTSKPTVPNPINDCVYQATFSPHDPSTLISVNSSSHYQV